MYTRALHVTAVSLLSVALLAGCSHEAETDVGSIANATPTSASTADTRANPESATPDSDATALPEQSANTAAPSENATPGKTSDAANETKLVADTVNGFGKLAKPFYDSNPGSKADEDVHKYIAEHMAGDKSATKLLPVYDFGMTLDEESITRNDSDLAWMVDFLSPEERKVAYRAEFAVIGDQVKIVSGEWTDHGRKITDADPEWIVRWGR